MIRELKLMLAVWFITRAYYITPQDHKAKTNLAKYIVDHIKEYE